ncbi:molybdenum cofactor guanylyltransferase [[Pseudomonas] boreopolis]|uniref:Molybdenum cofactor guanylyltransferase n=1 Tax=Xanthomonas boreopolis TaxID=86183 RepID=A0A919KJ92_9XANT|nr:molybdenum cofactor guanylyltransferase [[Pseudomonas] boreopolis]
MSLPDRQAWTGLVLAGGGSTRMGRDKAGLDWQGRPLIEHMQDLLRSAGAHRVVVSGDYPQYDAIADRRPGLGPLGGLHSAAAALPDGTLLVVPVDMPRLTTALLCRLLAAPAEYAVFSGQRLPMRMRLDEASRATLDRLVAAAERERSLRALQQALGCAELALDAGAEAALANCNTPAQWEALRA